MNLYRIPPLARFVGWIADKVNGPTCDVPGAITIGGMTLYLSPQPESIRRHEFVHIEQAARFCPWWLQWLPLRLRAWCGFTRFDAAYAIEHLRHGYANNVFEIEARLAEAEE